MIKKIFLILIIFIIPHFLYSQKIRNIDSIISVLKDIQTDTGRINSEIIIASELIRMDASKADSLARRALEASEKLDYIRGKSKALNILGILDIYKGDYQKGLNKLENSINLSLEINDSLTALKSLNNIGVINLNKGNYIDANDAFQKAMKIAERLNYKNLVLQLYNNLGVVNRNLKNLNLALEYFKKVEKTANIEDNKTMLANALGNIANVYSDLKNNKEALEYYNKALDLNEKLSDKYGQSIQLNNIGLTYYELKEYKKALYFYEKALKIRIRLNDKKGLSTTLNNIATIYLLQNNIQKSFEYAKSALNYAIETTSKEERKNTYKILSEIFYNSGDYKLAFENQSLYIAIQDSINNSEIVNKLNELQVKYQDERKQKEIELLNKDNHLKKAELAAKEADIHKKSWQRNAFIIAFLLLVILSIVIYRNYKIKLDANLQLTERNQEINIQKDELLKKNEDITASIQYAKRIQTAILPKDELIQDLLNEHFIFFKPRNIVSGDFYWIKRIKNFILVGVADCTGHGVPGAFMSILCTSLINEIIKNIRTSRGIYLFQASGILNQIRLNLKNAMGQDGKENEAKDGMDIAFCIIDLNNHKLQYAGANNPIFIFRDKTENQEITEPFDSPVRQHEIYEKCNLIELKPDKMPIGIHIKEKTSYTNHEFDLRKGDTIYLFTDGYVDQFGGETGSKFYKKRFKDLLLHNYNKPMNEQYKILDKTLKEWQGERDQVDDILVMGIRIPI